MADQWRIQAQYVVRALNELHHDVVVPGPKDFALGFHEFLILRAQSRFDWVAANLVRADQKKFLEPYKVIERGGIRFGVIGLVGPELSYPPEIRVSEPPLNALKRLYPEVEKKSDFVIVVTHQGLESDEKLAADFPKIKAIIGGGTQSFLQNPEVVGETKIFQSSFRNQYVGRISFNADRVISNHELVALDTHYEGKPNSISQLVNQFKAEVKRLNAASAAKKPTQVNHFATWPKCVECHVPQFEFWRKTPHANALESLQKSKQLYNKDCLRCHTLGLGDPKGFSNVKEMSKMTPESLVDYLKNLHTSATFTPPSPSVLAKSWAPVQCENCHGPAKGHPLQGNFFEKPVKEAKCIQCHTPERAPAWYNSQKKLDVEKFAEKKKQVSCPAL